LSKINVTKEQATIIKIVKEKKPIRVRERETGR
jgi:hypothetical protein